MSKSFTRRGSFVSNLIGNGTAFGVNLVVGIWFTAYLFRNLGPATYGLIPLATSVASYMSVLTLALTSSVGRCITIARGADNHAEVQRVFNTAFFGCVLFSLLLLPLMLLAAYFAPEMFSVPDGYENQTRILFAASGAVFLLTTATTAYGVAFFCRNRLDLSSSLNAGTTLLRVAVVWCLFQITVPSLWQVATGLLAAACLGTVVSVIFSRRLMPELQVRSSKFAAQTLRSLGATGAWVSVTQFGTILLLSLDLLMVNLLLGALVAGKYAIPLQLATLLRKLFTMIGGLFTPTIMSLHGAGRRDAMIAYVARAIRMVGLLAAIAAGLLCGFASELMTVWIGEDFANLAPLVWVMVAPLGMNLAVFPMFGLALTVNKVRGPAVVTILLGLLHVGVAYLLVERAGWGLYGVAVSSVALLSLKNLFYIPWYTARAVDIPLGSLLWPVASTASATVLVWGIAAATSWLFPVDSWRSLFAVGGLAGALAAAAVFFVFLDRASRVEISSLVRDKSRALLGRYA
jgi:O-antigen/teichoic acid export membrane protein